MLDHWQEGMRNSSFEWCKGLDFGNKRVQSVEIVKVEFYQEGGGVAVLVRATPVCPLGPGTPAPGRGPRITGSTAGRRHEMGMITVSTGAEFYSSYLFTYWKVILD